ncbi:hypothetical protein SAMN02745181_1229 [Rubritalea squalenifaciens DSM 18772]|uniref:Methyltransferase domain-containing protein n=1 Tax=Rubritalea squalenifaciens DSM 18772 TaxID=1123071 RepID=A0A1M6GQ28_9BACT|nr:hypothetical protein SAMN02745181_1229 [Rubritalea squalenifaciens DSM 18772]
MERAVLPELLDELAADDLRAVRSRRDLVFLNALMGNERWILRRLKKLLPAQGGRVIELGAGQGMLMRKIARAHPQARLEAIDLMPEPQGLGSVEWRQGDLFQMGLDFDGAVVVANLFLHHFEQAELRVLGELLQGAKVLIACEPERRSLHLWQGRVLSPLLGEVTRHDLAVSVGAGFRGDELMDFLGMDAGWQWQLERTWRGAHRVVGVRQ